VRALRRIALFLLLAAALPLAPGTPEAAAGTHRFKPLRVVGKVVVYRLPHMRPARIRHARLQARGVRRSLRLRRVRRAVRRGVLRTRLVRHGRRHSRLVLVTGRVRRQRAAARRPAGLACSAALTQVEVGSWPSGCWRPYADSSPFNRPLPANPRLLDNSSAIVRGLAGGPDKVTVGNSDTRWDYSHPVYYSRPGNPEFTLHCYESSWGRCPIEGERVRVPDRARPARGEDAHMTIVDTESGWEYDLYKVRSKPAGGGTLEFRWGGRTRIDGAGNGSGATVSGFGNLAGIMRAQELQAGEIRHALFMVIRCSSGTAVYPATGGSGSRCSDTGNAPPMGARFQLDMSDAEIGSLRVPGWKKTILRAMARYGMYFGDTGSGGWAVQMESGATYTSFGFQDALVQFARSVGVPGEGGEHVFDIGEGVDWRSRLRVIDPCEARGDC
jgi:hypothetical protein